MILVHQEEKDLIRDLSKLGLEIVPADLRDERGGDLRWFSYQGEEIGSEVKQFPSGLLTDLKTRRLGDQLVRLKDGFDIRLLFIKGLPEISTSGKVMLSYWRTDNRGKRVYERYETGWEWTSVMLHMFSAFWCLNILPIWCPEGTLATSIKVIYDWTTKPEDHGQWLDRLSKTTVLSKPNSMVDILSKFPEIGEKTAKLILREEKTLSKVFLDAVNNPEALTNIKGIGKKKQDGITSTLLREFKDKPEDVAEQDPFGTG